jgi:hypothetical protein
MTKRNIKIQEEMLLKEHNNPSEGVSKRSRDI